MMIFALVACIGVIIGCVGVACFRQGYNVGWAERSQDMVLPRKYLAETIRRLDDDEASHRHSAIDTKTIWH